MITDREIFRQEISHRNVLAREISHHRWTMFAINQGLFAAHSRSY